MRHRNKDGPEARERLEARADSVGSQPVTTILADQPAVSQCPQWCEGHLAGDVHISTDQVIKTSVGSETGEVYVSVEQTPGQPAAVRLSGAADRPMTPAQALELAQALIAAAFAAVTR